VLEFFFKISTKGQIMNITQNFETTEATLNDILAPYGSLENLALVTKVGEKTPNLVTKVGEKTPNPANPPAIISVGPGETIAQ
jgi:hypothetical protein